MKLTQDRVDRLKLPAGKAEHVEMDDALRGFGFRIRAHGGRSYILQYQLMGRKQKLTLGKAAEITCEQARLMADAKRGQIAKARLGLAIDPALERETAKAEAKKPKPKTFGAYIPDYLAVCEKTLKARSHEQVSYHLNNQWAALHPLALSEIDLAKVAAVLRTLAKKSRVAKGNRGRAKGGPAAANRARASLSAFFRWAMGEGHCGLNPVIGTNKRQENDPRDRSLTEAEIAAIWEAANPKTNYGKIVRLILLTGCRRTEIGGLRWSEYDSEKKTVTVPGGREGRSKNRLVFVLPLSETAVEILESAERRESKDLIFGDGAYGFSGWSGSKKRLDAASGVAGWVHHDIRRTMSAAVKSAGVWPHIVEAMLNHSDSKLTKTYTPHQLDVYRTQKREAFEIWASHLAVAIARANGANVTVLQSKKAR